MTGIPLHSVLDHLRRLNGITNAAQLSDRQLLNKFVTNKDQDAFAIVVTRHAPLVWGVCRRILGHHQDAEDAFQATFLILARRAGSIRWRLSVGGWLHTVAQRLAVRARKQAEQRRIHESETRRTPAADSSLRDLAAIVDEELQRLPAKYREPLLLHYLEGATAEAAARQLGLSRGTFYNRLAYGRELLRDRLSRQGLSLAAPLVAAALTAEVEAGSPPLIQATIRGVMGTVPERVAVLAAEALAIPVLTRLKVGLALVMLLGVSAGGLAMLVPRAPTEPSPQAERSADSPKSDAKAAANVDLHGDPLPPGAIARLGTSRFRIDSEQVSGMAFAPDGKTLAVESREGILLIDAATGKQTKSFRPPDSYSWLFALSPDSQQLLTVAFSDRLVEKKNGVETQRKERVLAWDVASGRKTTEAELKRVRCLGWTAEGQPLAVCQGKGDIILHEIATNRVRRFLAKDLPDPDHDIPPPCAVQNNILAVGDKASTIHIWNLVDGKKRWSLKAKGEFCFHHSLVPSPDGRWLASLTRDAPDKIIIQLWDLETGKATHTVADDQQFPQHAVFSPDGRTVATVNDKEVRLWDTARGRERGRLKADGRSFNLSAISFAPDGKTFATMEGHSGAVHLWDMATGTLKPEHAGHTTNWVQTASFSPDGKCVATTGGMDGTIRVWDAASGRQLVHLRRPSPNYASRCTFSADGRTLFSCWNDKLLLADAAIGRELRSLESVNMSMYLSNDLRKVITLRHMGGGSAYGGAGGGIGSGSNWQFTGWDIAARKQLFRRGLANLESHRDLVVSADGNMLAMPPAKTEPMHLEDTATGERLLNFPMRKVMTKPLAFSPDGRLLISETTTPAPQNDPEKFKRTLHIWEVLTGTELFSLTVYRNFFARAAFSLDGRLLATIAPEGEILLWDLTIGKELHRFKGFDSSVTSLAFSPDSRRLVSGL
jgi:RNA polymerase sigma factor (sigma-70 family)